MRVPTGHPNGDAQEADTVDARSPGVYCGEEWTARGRAQSNGSISVYGIYGIVNEGK